MKNNYKISLIFGILFLSLPILAARSICAAPAEATTSVSGAGEKPLTAVIVTTATSGRDNFFFRANGLYSKSNDPAGEINKHNWTYAWDYGDGITENIMFPNHQYTRGKLPVGVSDPNKLMASLTYNVKLTVNDGENQDETQIKIYYLPTTLRVADETGAIITTSPDSATPYNFSNPKGPNAVALVDSSYGQAPLKIHVSAEKSVAEGSYSAAPTTLSRQVQYRDTANIDSYIWDFGDGTIKTGIKTDHTYQEPGTYTLTLTVINKFKIVVNPGMANEVVREYELPSSQSYIIKAYDPDQAKARIVLDESLSLKAMLRNYTRKNGEPIVLDRAYVPMPVFFEGMHSTPREPPNIEEYTGDYIVDYEWDFGDGSDKFHGFNAAHVYEIPGVYTVSLKVTTESGQTSSEIIKIEALARDGVQYYVDSESGNDTNPGTNTAPWRTATKAFQALVTNQLNPGDAVYFRRGQVFEMSQKIDNGGKPAVYFTADSANPQEPLPIIKNKGLKNTYFINALTTNQSIINLAFSDLEIELKSDPVTYATGFIVGKGNTRNFLLLRCVGKNPINSFLGFNYVDSASKPSGCFIIDSKITQTEFYPDFSMLFYYRGSRIAMINSTVDRSYNHLMYTSTSLGLFYNNIISRPSWGRTALRIDGSGGFYDPDGDILIKNNKFLGWIDGIEGSGYTALTRPTDTASDSHSNYGREYDLQLLQLGPNTGKPERIRNVVVEGNIFTNCSSPMQIANCENITVKNNLFASPSSDNHGKFEIGADMQSKPNQHIKIINNTFLLKSTTTSTIGGAAFLVAKFNKPMAPEWVEDFGTEHSDINIKNNIIQISSGDEARVLRINAYSENLISQIKTDNNIYLMPQAPLVPGTGERKIFHVVNYNDYTLSQWKNAFPGHDSQSVFEDPGFVGPAELITHNPNIPDFKGAPLTLEEAEAEALGYMYKLKLSSTSPAINKGCVDYAPLVRNDFSGQLRSEIDQSIDIGAYEYSPASAPENQPLISSLSAVADSLNAPTVIDINADVTDADGDLLVFTWDFDGQEFAGQPPQRKSCANAGHHYAKLTVSDNSPLSLTNVRNAFTTIYPTVHMQGYFATEDKQVTIGSNTGNIQLSKGAKDIDGLTNTAGFAYTIVDVPLHGTITGTSPSFVYIPDANYNGLDRFTFKANDKGFDTNIAEVYVIIGNDAPSAPENLRITDQQLTSVSLAWDASIFDPDTSLKYYKVYRDGVSKTTRTVTNYTDSTLQSGMSYTYQISAVANDGMESAKSLPIIVTTGGVPNNPPSLASIPNKSIDENLTLSITLSAADTDGDALTYYASGLPQGASLNSATGVFAWTPSDTQSGNYNITFSVNDGKGGSDSKSCVITVNDVPVNRAPVANNQSVTITEDEAKAITLVATDEDNDTLIYVIDANPAHGILSGTGANKTYAPESNYNGTDSFTFKVNDGKLDSTVAIVSINITAVNDAPTVPQEVSAQAASAYQIDLSWSASSDIDAGDTITYNIYRNNEFLVSGLSALTYKDIGLTPLTSYTYKVEAQDSNAEKSTMSNAATATTLSEDPLILHVDFEGSIKDSSPSPAPGVTGINVQIANDEGSFSSSQKSCVKIPDATKLNPKNAISIVADIYPLDWNGNRRIAQKGSADNQYRLAAERGYFKFDIRFDSGSGAIVWARLPDIQRWTRIAAVYDPAANRAKVYYNGTKVADTYAKGTLASTQDPLYIGTKTAGSPEGDFFNGKIKDIKIYSKALAEGEIGSVPNNPPVANNKSVTVDEDASTPIDLSSSASDQDNDALTYGILTGPSRGVLSGTAPDLTYVPSPDYNGSDSFTFKVNDGKADSNIATVNINVVSINDVPAINSFSATPTSGNAPLAVNFSASASDIEGAVTYNWSFGDGQNSTQQNPTHVYNSANTYTAQLIVTDNSGASVTKSQAIAVQSALPTAPGSLTAALTSDNKIILKWLDKSTNETGFVIEKAASPSAASVVELIDVGSNTTSCIDANVKYKQTWVYRIKAVNAAGSSGYSNWAAVTVNRRSKP